MDKPLEINENLDIEKVKELMSKIYEEIVLGICHILTNSVTVTFSKRAYKDLK